jgi:hypothetical protein
MARAWATPWTSRAHCALDQETLCAQRTEEYRSALSLACYLLARERTMAGGGFWAIWAVRNSKPDALSCVDVYLQHYRAGGIATAAAYVARYTLADVMEGGQASRKDWLDNWLGEDGSAKITIGPLKQEVLDRIAHNRTCGLTDEKVMRLVEGSWGTETASWGESLLLLSIETDY